MSSCSHCGKQRAALKRCSRCKQASYCGAECQNAAWKGHKISCVTLDDVIARFKAAKVRKDWREVLKWEGRMEEMMERQTDAGCSAILAVFADAHREELSSKGGTDHAHSLVRLETRRVEVLGKMQRFRDQGEVLFNVADQLRDLDRGQEAETYLQRARKIAEAHGFFSVECRSCLGLGSLAVVEGREEEGVDLLRNALACVPLCEADDTLMELNVLFNLIDVLFYTHAFDEAEPLVARYREAAKAESEEQGRLDMSELWSLYMSARLHEVLCTCTLCWKAPHTARPLHSTKTDSVCHIFRLVRLSTPALFDAPALFRHAGGLTRPRRRCALCSTSCATTRQQCKTCPIPVKHCCVAPPRNSRSSTRSMGMRSSSSWWQPRRPSFRILCRNQVRWCFVTHPHRLSPPPHP